MKYQVDQVLVKGLVCQLILDQVLGLVQIDFDISQFYASKGALSLISDEACFGLVPVSVSYRSDYSYQSYTSAL